MPSQQQEPPCPQCGAAMSFRLGEFECESCGYIEPVVKPQEQRGTGPGFRREQWGGGTAFPSSHGGGNYSLPGQYQGTPAAPPPPPPGSTFYGQNNIYGSPYESAPPPNTGSLDIEKKIYFGLQVASNLFLAVMLIIGAGFASSAAGMRELAELDVPPGVIPGIVVIVVIAQFLGLALSWFVLFSDQTWIKWTCGGCTALSLLFVLIGMFAPVASAIEGGSNIFSGIIQLALSGWFLSILWRDIQRLQDYG